MIFFYIIHYYRTCCAVSAYVIIPLQDYCNIMDWNNILHPYMGSWHELKSKVEKNKF